MRSIVDRKVSFYGTIDAFDSNHQDYCMRYLPDFTEPIVWSIKFLGGDSDEPKNNDGRMVCYWCDNVKTDHVDGGFKFYDVCPTCGR